MAAYWEPENIPASDASGWAHVKGLPKQASYNSDLPTGVAHKGSKTEEPRQIGNVVQALDIFDFAQPTAGRPLELEDSLMFCLRLL